MIVLIVMYVVATADVGAVVVVPYVVAVTAVPIVMFVASWC